MLCIFKSIIMVFIGFGLSSTCNSQNITNEDNRDLYNAQFALSICNQPEIISELELLPQQAMEIKELYEFSIQEKNVLSKKLGVDGYNFKDLVRDTTKNELYYGKLIINKLAPWQVERMSQLAFQQSHGVANVTLGLDGKNIESLLSLTQSQIDEIKNKSANINKKIAELKKELNDDLNLIRDRHFKESMEILNPKQRTEFKELLGRIYFPIL